MLRPKAFAYAQNNPRLLERPGCLSPDAFLSDSLKGLSVRAFAFYAVSPLTQLHVIPLSELLRIKELLTA